MRFLGWLFGACLLMQLAGCGSAASDCEPGPIQGDLGDPQKRDNSDATTGLGLHEAPSTPEKGGCRFFCGDMVKVPSGAFVMGCQDVEEGQCRFNEKPKHTVLLDGFWIDKYEATYAQFAEFLNKNQTGETSDGNIHQLTSYTFERQGDKYVAVGILANYAVENATWEGARKFCEWAGKRLCTEAEWERAARGDGARRYPWGDEPPSCPGVSMLNAGGPVFDPEPACGLRLSYLPEVGDLHWVGNGGPPAKFYLDESPFGVMNMAGNVSEWVSDLYGANYYEASPLHGPIGPENADLGIGVTKAAYRVVRGGRGSWDEPLAFRISFRQAVDPANTKIKWGSGTIPMDWGSTSEVGIRCCLGGGPQ